MLLMNNANHHRAIPPPHDKKKQLKTLQLSPGVNEIPEPEWAEAKKLKVIQALLDENTLEEIVPKGSKKPAKTLADLKDVEAIKLVKETIDLDLLASWREKASAPVLKAIDAQIDELKKTEPKK